MNLFQKLGENNFFKHHWEKEPLLIKNFIDGPQSLLNSDELIDMAANEYFESRIVGEKDGNISIQHGPILLAGLQKEFNTWTLINHNVNLYSKELIAIQKQFEFLPSWLFDDAMTTLSNKGSTIGAHIDNYNVFIIQLSGQRKWEIEKNANPEYHEGLEVKILKEFNPSETHILNPGELLYLPPQAAHRGTSLTDSLSLSFGFKSMEDKALVEQFAIELVNEFESDLFYQTSFTTASKDPLLIDQKIIADIKERIIKNISADKFIEGALLKFTSGSKRPVQEVENSKNEDFFAKATTHPLFKDEFTRVSAIKTANEYMVSINDFSFQAGPDEYQFIKTINGLTCEDEINIKDYPDFKNLLHTLYQKGIIFFNEEN